MKKYIKYLFIGLIAFCFANAKPEIDWIRNIGGVTNEEIMDTIEVKDGYVFVTNSYGDKELGNNGELDAIIAKYDFNGNREWIKIFGGSSYDYFSSIIEVEDGYVVVGESSSKDAGFENKGMVDGIIVKYDKDGNQEWIKSFGGSDNDFFNSVIEVEDGYIVVGESRSKDLGFKNKGDAIILKFDKTGNLKWAKNFGGKYSDIFNSIIKIEDGYVVVGETWSPDAGFELKGESDAIIVKYDKDGNQKWVNTLVNPIILPFFHCLK